MGYHIVTCIVSGVYKYRKAWTQEKRGIGLADIKDEYDEMIFDSSRATGGELYQSTLVELQNVWFDDISSWGTDSDLTLTDASGRSLNVHLGLDESFDKQAAPEGMFNVIGIMDQNDFNGTAGYQLLAMNAGDFQVVPEPSSAALVLLGGAGLLPGGYLSRRRQR